MRVLALVTEAFGGHGGIALYHRDLLTALCAHEDCTEVVAVPRLMESEGEPLPRKLTFVTSGLGGKVPYLTTVLRRAASGPGLHLVVCGHIHLLPLACLVGRVRRIPVILIIHGIDAWQPTGSPAADFLAGRVHACVSISRVTLDRFLRWSRLPDHRAFILPNAVHGERFGVMPPSGQLAVRYGLVGKTVLMTLGRISSRERYKGFDEVLELLPGLAGENPDIAYLVVGDGDDLDRLKKKAVHLGVADRVVFTGRIPESEKADHYRLAHAFVMPGRGEGFGFVFLEAMASGVPVVASALDGSREAVLNGSLGFVVNPDRPQEVRAGILAALKAPRGVVPDGLDHFSFANFTRRLHGIVDGVMDGRGANGEKGL